MRVLLVTPPMTQVNTPYPATAYLCGFLRSRGIEAEQRDASIDLLDYLLSSQGLTDVAEEIANLDPDLVGPNAQHFLDNAGAYIATIDGVVRFLRGNDPTLSSRIAARRLLPEGARFESLVQQDLQWAFGAVGAGDRAKMLASLYIDDIADAIKEGVDPRFELTRYGEQLASSNISFDALAEAQSDAHTLIDELVDELYESYLQEVEPDLVCISVPFPGNMLGALRLARLCKARGQEAEDDDGDFGGDQASDDNHSDEQNERSEPVAVAVGGGFVSTELRDMTDVRFFEDVDFLVFDDGETPLLHLIEHLRGDREASEISRTWSCTDGRITRPGTTAPDVPMAERGRPTYDGLKLGRYLSLMEMPNPMHRLWSDGHWNKLTLAHGCYWKQCTFCDTGLDYIANYQKTPEDLVVDHMEGLIEETARSGFHFVDEAAPPAALGRVADRLVERGIVCSWWGNVRFEKAFTPELCQRLAASGCIAFTGGLEVASDRLLKRMRKGVTIEQVARVTRSMRDAGILVHAYLMYGFPTQTEQETIDSLEVVRQLFEHGCLESAFWHRLSVTVHNPIGRAPDEYGITLNDPYDTAPPDRIFARNGVPHTDPTPCDHDVLGRGLRAAVYNYMHGVALDRPAHEWFEGKVPRTTVPPTRIAKALRSRR